jgi:DcaP outer membrane protein
MNRLISSDTCDYHLCKSFRALAILLLFLPGIRTFAQDPTPDASKPNFDIYGHAMVDMGYDFKQTDPNWFDVIRPSRLPSFKDEFGKDGNFYSGVRQSRLGVRGYIPTSLGQIKTIFEFELFGTGVDAGQTTFRLRHAWGELGRFGGGQTWSPFMDPDVFPNSLEYWGPNGMVFFRNVQVRYTPWSKGDSRLVIAAERPGASADQGVYAGRIELQGVRPRFPMPDISGHLRLAGSSGHVQIAGLYRKIKWDDLNATSTRDLSGDANGWGVNVSSNVKMSKRVWRLQAVYGHGIQNYMNDAPADVGIADNFSNSQTPVTGKALPILGLVGFLDLNWSSRVTSTIGYSRVDIDNTAAQDANAFKSGQYAVTNVLFYPTKGFLLGPEFQWGYRDNKGGWHTPDYRIQFSVKYNFSMRVGG